MKHARLTLKIFALIILNDLVDTVSQLCMKKGLVIASPLLVGVGIVIFALSFIIWITVLYKTDLSIAMPLGSLSYILVPLFAVVFLHERVDIVRWAGIACIVLGIYFVSQSSKPRNAVGES